MAGRFYEVRVARSSDKEIQGLPSEIRKRVEDAIRGLASNPFPSGCEKLQGERNRWRLRVGKYRIIYSVDTEQRIVRVEKVRLRSEAYR
ncbi:MAG: hypothetical protein PVTTEEND_002153 [Candidatus Fervidibacter sp.]|jgi:Cytotoxic translational repressor of toxin-antitoxin stability system